RRPILPAEHERLHGVGRKERAQWFAEHFEHRGQRFERHRTLVSLEQRDKPLGYTSAIRQFFLGELVRQPDFANPSANIHGALPMFINSPPSTTRPGRG